jgi:hypothetical protein
MMGRATSEFMTKLLRVDVVDGLAGECRSHEDDFGGEFPCVKVVMGGLAGLGF